MPITSFYACLLALIFVSLVLYVGSMRAKTEISILDGGNLELAERIRRHANFVENVPIPLVLLFAIELNGAPSLLLHCLGIVLVLSRIAHPFGVTQMRLRTAARGLGSLGTLAVTVVATAVGIWEFSVG